MTPYYTSPDGDIYQGDALEVLSGMEANSCHMVCTSPPYWGLRDYGVAGQLGLEKTPEKYVEKLVAIFREVKRVLRDDGTLWLNLGDTYAAARSYQVPDGKYKDVGNKVGHSVPDGLKQKDLVGIPWMVAFALRADGWYLRSDIIWAKKNPMPESVTDRPTKSHEYIFLLTKSPQYFYDAEAIKEPSSDPVGSANRYKSNFNAYNGGMETGAISRNNPIAKLEFNGKRNKRSVWTIATKPFSKAHFATFPPALIEPCILAGCPKGGTVLDPFGGAMTSAIVAYKHGRYFKMIELSEAYIQDIGIPRIEQETKQWKLPMVGV